MIRYCGWTLLSGLWVSVFLVCYALSRERFTSLVVSTRGYPWTGQCDAVNAAVELKCDFFWLAMRFS